MLRDDGTVFLNLGDSYFGSSQTGGTNSKEGSAKRQERVLNSPSSALNFQNAAAYDISGKAPVSYPAHDCLCGNLCDVCRVVYRNHRFRNDGLLVAMLTASMSESSREHKESQSGHLPTSDFSQEAIHISSATRGLSPVPSRVAAPLRASLVSMIGESSPLLLDECLQRGIRGDVCLLCARSLTAYVQECVCNWASQSSLGLSSTSTPHLETSTHDNTLIGGAFGPHNGDKTYDCSCQDYTTTCRHGKLKPKDLIGIPWRVAFALQADGWWLRQDIIWHKVNAMPSSAKDRCTGAHEYIFLLSKSARYYYDYKAIAEPCAESSVKRNQYGQSEAACNDVSVSRKQGAGEKVSPDGLANKRSVWTVATQPFPEAHFATYPSKLIEPCILAGCPPRGKRCDCDEIINTPVGEGCVDDPTIVTGRAGMGRPRKEVEGVRPITKRQQRSDAQQIKQSPHISEIRLMCGNAFDHYIRTDASGARPLPHQIRTELLRRAWITEAAPCDCPEQPAGIVLDPFTGSGTTGIVAINNGRRFIGAELNPEYHAMAVRRISQAANRLDTKAALIAEPAPKQGLFA